VSLFKLRVEEVNLGFGFGGISIRLSPSPQIDTQFAAVIYAL